MSAVFVHERVRARRRRRKINKIENEFCARGGMEDDGDEIFLCVFLCSLFVNNKTTSSQKFLCVLVREKVRVLIYF
jgi:hypothetical protein